MTWPGIKAAGAAALLLLITGCFEDVSPSGSADDDAGDSGTTSVVTSGADSSGEPSPSSSTDPVMTSGASSGFGTNGSTGLGGTTSWDSSTGPRPPGARVDFYPRACEVKTLWVSQDGAAGCQSGNLPNGEVELFENEGDFTQVISARPPTQDGTVTIAGQFTGLSLAEFAAPVLRGQAGCRVDEKCDLTLAIRTRHPLSGAEDIQAGSVSGSRTPFKIDVDLSAFAGLDDVEVVLESNTSISPAGGEDAPAVLWSDVRIEEG